MIKNNLGEIFYAGLTRQTLKARFNQHRSKRNISNSEYYIELVLDNLTIDQAVLLEEMLIEQHNLRNKGWNKSPKSINGYSNQHSEEQKAKWSKERKGIKVSSEHAKKNRVARLNVKNSPDHNKKISEGNAKPVICLTNGKTYKSARKAAKELNVSYCKISEVCKGKRPHTKGLVFKFTNNKAVEADRNDQPS